MQIYKISLNNNKYQIVFVLLQSPFGDRHCGNKESALYSINRQFKKVQRGTEDSSYQVGCPTVRLYKRLAMLLSMHGRQPTFFAYKLC